MNTDKQTIEIQKSEERTGMKEKGKEDGEDIVGNVSWIEEMKGEEKKMGRQKE